jgi:hypothetical protein
VSTRSAYDVVSVKDDSEAYEYLTKAYLEWVHDPKCDTNYNRVVQVRGEKRHVNFLRDDSIGDPKKPDEDDRPNIQVINISAETDIFFPVYYFHSSIGEGDGRGGKCQTIEDCKQVAEEDLSKIRTDDDGNQMIWAKISIDGRVDLIPLTSNFNNYRLPDSPLTITVSDNRLNREPEYHLKPGTYEGVVRGWFMYLRNLKKGDYVLFFGGEASNFITRSVYIIHVK